LVYSQNNNMHNYVMSIFYAMLSYGEGITAMDTYHEYFICIIYFDYYCYRTRKNTSSSPSHIKSYAARMTGIISTMAPDPS
jgi:hypothetical protein